MTGKQPPATGIETQTETEPPVTGEPPATGLEIVIEPPVTGKQPPATGKPPAKKKSHIFSDPGVSGSQPPASQTLLESDFEVSPTPSQKDKEKLTEAQ